MKSRDRKSTKDTTTAASQVTHQITINHPATEDQHHLLLTTKSSIDSTDGAPHTLPNHDDGRLDADSPFNFGDPSKLHFHEHFTSRKGSKKSSARPSSSMRCVIPSPSSTSSRFTTTSGGGGGGMVGCNSGLGRRRKSWVIHSPDDESSESEEDGDIGVVGWTCSGSREVRNHLKPSKIRDSSRGNTVDNEFNQNYDDRASLNGSEGIENKSELNDDMHIRSTSSQLERYNTRDDSEHEHQIQQQFYYFGQNFDNEKDEDQNMSKNRTNDDITTENSSGKDQNSEGGREIVDNSTFIHPIELVSPARKKKSSKNETFIDMAANTRINEARIIKHVDEEGESAGGPRFEPNTVMFKLSDYSNNISDVHVAEIIDEFEKQFQYETKALRGVRLVGNTVYICVDKKETVEYLLTYGFYLRGVSIKVSDIAKDSIILCLEGVPHYITDSTINMAVSGFGITIGQVIRDIYKGVDTGRRYIQLKSRNVNNQSRPDFISIGGSQIRISVINNEGEYNNGELNRLMERLSVSGGKSGGDVETSHNKLSQQTNMALFDQSTDFSSSIFHTEDDSISVPNFMFTSDDLHQQNNIPSEISTPTNHICDLIEASAPTLTGCGLDDIYDVPTNDPPLVSPPPYLRDTTPSSVSTEKGSLFGGDDYAMVNKEHKKMKKKTIKSDFKEFSTSVMNVKTTTGSSESPVATPKNGRNNIAHHVLRNGENIRQASSPSKARLLMNQSTCPCCYNNNNTRRGNNIGLTSSTTSLTVGRTINDILRKDCNPDQTAVVVNPCERFDEKQSMSQSHKPKKQNKRRKQCNTPISSTLADEGSSTASRVDKRLADCLDELLLSPSPSSDESERVVLDKDNLGQHFRRANQDFPSDIPSKDIVNNNDPFHLNKSVSEKNGDNKKWSPSAPPVQKSPPKSDKDTISHSQIPSKRKTSILLYRDKGGLLVQSALSKSKRKFTTTPSDEKNDHNSNMETENSENGAKKSGSKKLDDDDEVYVRGEKEDIIVENNTTTHKTEPRKKWGGSGSEQLANQGGRKESSASYKTRKDLALTRDLPWCGCWGTSCM